MHMLVLKQRLV